MTLRSPERETGDFVDDFLDSLSPSSIPISEYVDWERIDDYVEEHENEIHKIEDVSRESEDEFGNELCKTLIKYPRTERLLSLLFELVSERNPPFVAVEGTWSIEEYAKRIENGNQDDANEIVDLLCKIGLYRSLSSISDLNTYLRGVSVGFESNKRKGRQGSQFSSAVEPLLQALVEELQASGTDVELKEEHSISYGEDNDKTKRVDFATIHNGNVDIIFELNSYTTTGSKPTEIVRGYTETAELVRESDMEYVWISDGSGWKDMKPGIERAYNEVVDFYNYGLLEKEFPQNLADYYGITINNFDITRTDSERVDKKDSQTDFSEFV